MPFLLVFVTGPIGSGKTTALRGVSEQCREAGLTVAGFLQIASGTRSPGAEQYLVQPLTGDPPTVVAERTPEGYRFHDQGWEVAAGCVQNADVFIADEFGKQEAGGEGHLRWWPDLVRRDPEVVVLAVREDAVDAIAAQLGRTPDRVLAPDQADDIPQLALERRDWRRVGLWGAAGGGVEVSLGSALHGALVPFRGNVLAAIQASILAECSLGLGRPARVAWAGVVASGLKALSPAGSRLRPMIAITVQACLFASAVSVFGARRMGFWTGAFLVGAWASAQGILLQWLLAGNDLFRAYAMLLERVRIPEGSLGWALSLYVLLGGLASLGWVALVNRRAPRPTPPRLSPAASVWWSISPLVVIAVLMAVAGSGAEVIFWATLRGAVILALMVVIARSFRPARWAAWLRRRGLDGPAHALEVGLRRD